ncbi:MAG: type IX secretion system protein PorQ [Prevotella sp.]|nr:type IX secretion system protein PorQ [Prevotella sp.]MBR1463560.1 type IX secretion system protein PorQ [Prevotella sp.]
MKKVIIAAIFTLVAATDIAQESQTEYNFLRIPVSAHAAALGGDNISVIEDDATLMTSNPALLSSVSDKMLCLNYMNYMEGANTASAAFTKILTERMSVGFLAQYLDYGKIKEVDESNIISGDFTAKDIALSATLSYTLGENIAGGITARFINSYIGNFSSLALGVDLGINYYDPEKEWSASAVVKNLGGELDPYEDEYGKLPLDLQFGVTKKLTGAPFRLSATLVDMNHLSQRFINHVAAGVDIILSPQLYVAGGYSFRHAREMSIVSEGEERGSSHGAGLSIGAGLLLDRFKLNLAYGKYHVSSHSVIINASFQL